MPERATLRAEIESLRYLIKKYASVTRNSGTAASGLRRMHERRLAQAELAASKLATADALARTP